MRIFKEFSGIYSIDSIEQWEKQTNNYIGFWVSNIDEDLIFDERKLVKYDIISSDGKSVEGVGSHSELVFVLTHFIKGFKGNFIFTEKFYKDVENQVKTIFS